MIEETRVNEEKPVPVSLRPQQIPYRLASDRNWTSTARGRHRFGNDVKVAKRLILKE
jgi:hypothetical protein